MYANRDRIECDACPSTVTRLNVRNNRPLDGCRNENRFRIISTVGEKRQRAIHTKKERLSVIFPKRNLNKNSNWENVTSFGYLIIPSVKLTGNFGRKCNKIKPLGMKLLDNSMGMCLRSIYLSISLALALTIYICNQYSWLCMYVYVCCYVICTLVGCFELCALGLDFVTMNDDQYNFYCATADRRKTDSPNRWSHNTISMWNPWNQYSMRPSTKCLTMICKYCSHTGLANIFPSVTFCYELASWFGFYSATLEFIFEILWVSTEFSAVFDCLIENGR